VLFRFAVAFFKYVEEDILSKTSTLELNHFMRIMGEKITDVQRVAQVITHTMFGNMHIDVDVHTIKRVFSVNENFCNPIPK
jgi:hypothetical protein